MKPRRRRRNRPNSPKYVSASLVGALLVLTVSGAQGQEPAPSSPAETSTPEGGAPVEAAISLLDLLQMEVITASHISESVGQAPAVIEVVTSEDIERYGFRTLGEALESVAGLDVVSDHYQQNLGVRGVSSGDRGSSRIVKVMVNGQPTSFRPSSENFLGVEAIPLHAVERIEIIRGPGTVLYGANAFLGVINIIMKEAFQVQGARMSGGVQAGPHESTPFGEGLLGLDEGAWSLVASASGERQRKFGYPLVPLPGREPIELGESEADGHLSGSAWGSLSLFPNKENTLRLDTQFQRLARDAEFTAWGPLAHDNHLVLDNGYVRFTYEAEWIESLHWKLSGAYAWGAVGDRDRLNVGSDLDTHLERDMGYKARDTSVSVRYQFPGESHFGVGLDSSVESHTLLAHYLVTQEGDRILNPPGNAQTGGREFLSIGAYANSTLYPFELANITPLSRLGLTGGVRLDSHNIYGEVFNTRAGVVYGVTEKTYIKLLYGSSYRAPSSTQLYANYVEPGGTIGNSELRPERAKTLEAAIGATLPKGFTARLNLFSTHIEDRVEIHQSSLSTPVSNRQPANSTPIRSWGGESQLDYRWHDFSSYASYSYQHSVFTRRNQLSVEADLVDVATAAYPRHLIKFGASADFPQLYLRLSASGRWISARTSSLENNAVVNGRDFLVERYHLDPYLLVDLTVASMDVQFWDYRETKLQGKVRNLFNTTYVYPGYSVFDIPGFARSYELSLSQEF